MSDSSRVLTTRDDQAQTQADQSASQTSDIEHKSTNQITSDNDLGSGVVSSDLWSAAYREAVFSLGKDIDVAILKGEHVAQLFKGLEDMDKGATQETAFARGVKYLRSIQVPLERFKLALDLSSPLTSIEPTAATVFGVLRSVTAVSFFSQRSCALQHCKDESTILADMKYTDCYQLCNCRSTVCKAHRGNARTNLLHR